MSTGDGEVRLWESVVQFLLYLGEICPYTMHRQRHESLASLFLPCRCIKLGYVYMMSKSEQLEVYFKSTEFGKRLGGTTGLGGTDADKGDCATVVEMYLATRSNIDDSRERNDSESSGDLFRDVSPFRFIDREWNTDVSAPFVGLAPPCFGLELHLF